MIGVSVGNYVIAEKIGEGGMGIVYRASHQTLGRQVAVKVLHGDSHRAPEMISRFFNEARAATEIRNEHIIDVLDFGHTQDGRPYIVMEWLEGENLAALLEREPVLDHRRALDLLRGIGEALAAAHERGVIHRDLKPDNIFLQRKGQRQEFIKVLDFGIAKLLQNDGPNDFKTRSGMLLGTPAYMSPEQCRGARDIDQRSDIYALGVIAYQMFTGQLPFRAEGLGELIYKHMSEAPRPPSSLRPTIAEPVSAAILKALAKEPVDRFARVGDFIAALAQGLGADEGIVSRTDGAPSGSNATTGSGAMASGGATASTRPFGALSTEVFGAATTVAPAVPATPPGRGTSRPRRAFATTLSPLEVTSGDPRKRAPVAIIAAALVAGVAGSVGWWLVRGAGNYTGPAKTTAPAAGTSATSRAGVATENRPAAQPTVPPAPAIESPPSASTARDATRATRPGGPDAGASGHASGPDPGHRRRAVVRPSEALEEPPASATGSDIIRPPRPLDPAARERGKTGGDPAVYRGRKLEIEREFP